MECGGCKSTLVKNKYMKCNTCKYTFCFTCLNVDSKDISDSDVVASLKCPSCANVTRRRYDDKSPARAGRADAILQKTTLRLQGNHASTSTTVPTLPTLAEISALLDQKLSPASPAMQDLRAALREDVKAMIATEMSKAINEVKDDFTKTTDFIMTEVNDTKAKINEKNRIIEELQSDHSKMNLEILNLNKRISSLEKISRGLNIELQALPESRNENVLVLFKNICNAISCPITDTDIRACRRVAKLNVSSTRPRNVIVTLASSRLRDNLLSAAHRYNKSHPKNLLSSLHAGIEGDNNRIYLSEHLSLETKKLHFAARDFAKLNGYKFVWVKYGQIYVRKDPSTDAIRIKDEDFLKTLK